MPKLTSLTINEKKIGCSDTVLFLNPVELHTYNTDNAVGTYKYDISQYIPNDDFQYLGYFSCESIATFGSSSVWSNCYLKDTNTNYQLIVSQVLDSANQRYQKVFVWFPIPENKIITKIIGGTNCERCYIRLLGYQKLNSSKLI